MQRAIKKALNAVRSIENQWVAKNFYGPTLLQQKNILKAIRRHARKYGVNEASLKDAVLFQPLYKKE
jgi:hypothetical protein